MNVMTVAVFAVLAVLAGIDQVPGEKDKEFGTRPIVPVAVPPGARADSLNARLVKGWGTDTSLLAERRFVVLDPREVRERATRLLAGSSGDSARVLMVLTRPNGQQLTVLLDGERKLEAKYTYADDATGPAAHVYNCRFQECVMSMFNLHVTDDRVWFNGPAAIPGTKLLVTLHSIDGMTHALVERKRIVYGGDR